MARQNRLFNSRILSQLVSGRQQAATHRKRTKLHLEQLEPRMLMNADNNPAPLATIDDGAQLLSIAPVPLVSADSLSIADDIGWYQSSPRLLPAAPENGFGSEQELRDWLITAIDTEYGSLFGASYKNLGIYCWGCDTDIIRTTPIFTLFNNDSLASSSFSGTNVQEEGVDEADLVETDGKYLYLVTGNELLIVDASDGENLSIVSRIELDSHPTGIYLSGNRLTLLSTNSATANSYFGNDWLNSSNSATTHATTTVTVLDISNRATPSQVQKTELQGSLVSSRMVDGQLCLVLSQQRPFHLQHPQIHSTYNEETGQTDSFYETRGEYLDRVLDDMVGSLLQTYRTLSVSGEVINETSLVPIDELVIPGQSENSTRTIIATFDVHSNEAGPSGVRMLHTKGATEVYATQDYLYVFGQSNHSHNETAIWKFGFNTGNHSIKLAAKGFVEGSILNQFSVDEHDGYLRVVTTGSSWNAGQSLLVFDQVGHQLKEVGRVENLAPGERLHSVRFLEDQAFVVTFRKVDPLFAIDLSDPTNPIVAGELKIPGYSDYLHPIDENHLLGIGRGASESRGLFQEMQISIFDVSDLNDPQLAHRFSLEGGRSTASIATGGRWTQGDGDHHAVSYFPSEQILALPVYSADQWGGSLAGIDNTPIFVVGGSGLQVFSVDIDSGFESLAIIEHDSPIFRSLRIGDSLLAISAGEITSHDINGSINQLDSLQLLVGSETSLVELISYDTFIHQSTDLAALAHRLSAKLGLAEETFSATFNLPTTRQFVANEAPFTELPDAPFALNDNRADAADLAFTALDSDDGEDIRFNLADSILNELVDASLGN